MDTNRSESSRDYQAIVERVPAIVYIAGTGENGVWHYVNEWIQPILGFTVEEWTSDPTLWARQLHPEDREKALAAEAESTTQFGAANSRDDSAAYFLDYRMLHKGGHVVWIRDSSVLVPGVDGTPLWHGVLMDISDQKLIEQQLERRRAAQATVARLGKHALAGTPIPDLLAEACRVAAEALKIEAATIAQTSEDRNSLELRADYGSETEERLRHNERLDPRSPFGHTLLTGKPLLVQDWDQETRFRRPDPLNHEDVKSSIGVRIEGPVHSWGVFGAFSSRPHSFSEHDVDFVVSLANILADAIERQEAEDAMQHRALHDPLTSLPNRVLFTDRLEQALERVRRHTGSLAAILFIDVDHFKRVNDTLGHQAGDDLLIGVATRLREAVRPSDTVARFGGDEFGLLLEEIASERVAIATAERVAAGFARPFVLDAGSQFATVSIGVAIADGRQDAQTMLKDADAAMYRAKQRGRARYDLFDEDLRVRALARGRMENELRRAIELNELRVVYQPVMRLTDESLSGLEALLRWEHPQRGVVLPREFISVAEESGLIDRVGLWAIEQALRDAARWKDARPDQPPLGLGINVSTHQLHNRRFSEQLADLIDAGEIDAENIHLEFDERVLREDAEQIHRNLLALKGTGVRLVIHDFGTGDSSLTRLVELPIDAIKVDRRFVAALGCDDDARRIAQAVAATGHALGVSVVGLGAETVAQADELRRLGCTHAQGLFYSAPMTAAEVARIVADESLLRQKLS